MGVRCWTVLPIESARLKTVTYLPLLSTDPCADKLHKHTHTSSYAAQGLLHYYYGDMGVCVCMYVALWFGTSKNLVLTISRSNVL